MPIQDDKNAEILEVPQSSEVYERLPEPKQNNIIASDEIKIWKARIAVARKIRNTKHKNLNKLIDFYEGIQWHLDDNILPKDKTTVNLIFSNIKKELPYLYFQNPTPIVNPRSGEYELNAFAVQELIKYYTKYNLGTTLKKHVRLAILDAKFSFGTLKVSYTPRFSANPNKDQPILAGYDSFNEPIFVINEDGSVATEPNEILVSELYGIERISPREMLIDSECRNFIERARWVGQEIIKPLSYLQKSKLYTNTKYLRRNVELSDFFKDSLNKKQDEISAVRELEGTDNELVKFVEIYDIENEKLLVLPDNENFFIREESFFMSPFSFLKFNESPDNWYGPSDIAQEKPIQEEVNVGRSMMITHARRAARKYYYSEDTFRGIEDEEGIEALKDPEDMTLVKVSDYDKPPKAIDVAQQDPAIFQNLMQSRLDFNIVSGSTEAERGMSERRKTGKEASFQEGHSTVRRTDKQSLVADFIVDTYRNLAKLMQATLTKAQAIKVIGKTGIFWTEVKREDIQGEFFFDIEVSELRPQIPEQDRQELSEFIFALSNFLTVVLSNPVGPMIFNIQGLVSEFCKSYPSIKSEKILNMNVTPEQIANMLIQQMQGGKKDADLPV